MVNYYETETDYRRLSREKDKVIAELRKSLDNTSLTAKRNLTRARKAEARVKELVAILETTGETS